MKQYFAHYGFNESYMIVQSLAGRETAEQEDSPERLAALVFLAFTYESALNHLGELAFPSWQEHFERLGPEGKLALLCEKARMKPDFSAPPFQSFSTVIKIRNGLAHHKVSFLEVSPKALNTPSQWPQPKWKMQARSLSIKSALSDLDAMIDQLQNLLEVWLPARFILMEHIQK
jgi:hypothetical protein